MKIPNYLRGMTGHIGDYTVYEANGRTVVRSRHNRKPSTGRSPAQLRQRARWSNAVNLWRRFPEGYRPTYDNRRPGQTNMNVFASMALHSDPIYFTHHQGADGACVITPLCISHGPLDSIGIISDSNGIRSSIAVGNLDGNPSVGDVALAIVNSNLRFEPGDSIRFYLVEQFWDRGNAIPTVRVHCDDLVLAYHDKTPLHEATGGSPGFVLRDGYLAYAGELCGGLVWIHVRSRGSLRHSTQCLHCTNPYIARFGSAEALQQAIESFEV